jgi:hypothetical protein
MDVIIHNATSSSDMLFRSSSAADNCADPGQLPNGGNTPLPPSSAGYTPGQQLFFYCDAGYEIKNKACIVCGANGWEPQSSAQPQCISNASAPHTPIPDPGSCTCNIATGFYRCAQDPTPVRQNIAVDPDYLFPPFASNDSPQLQHSTVLPPNLERNARLLRARVVHGILHRNVQNGATTAQLTDHFRLVLQ